VSERKPCIYALHSYCITYKHLSDNGIEVSNWGSEEWVKLHCAMCVKSVYAKSKFKIVKSYSVVNTL